jgi:hypothetical protein
VIEQFPHLKKKPYWGNHLWAKNSCVDTLGLNPEMIGDYVEYQEAKAKPGPLGLDALLFSLQLAAYLFQYGCFLKQDLIKPS